MINGVLWFLACTYSAVLLGLLAKILYTHCKEGNQLQWFEAIIFIFVVALWPAVFGCVLLDRWNTKRKRAL